MSGAGILREERIGGQRLILGDCLQVMPGLGRFDAVVTDPPYKATILDPFMGSGTTLVACSDWAATAPGSNLTPSISRLPAAAWTKPRASLIC
jgi:hypothetical protein